jgi:hypothetical protein
MYLLSTITLIKDIKKAKCTYIQKQVSLHATGKYIMQTAINKLEHLTELAIYIEQKNAN